MACYDEFDGKNWMLSSKDNGSVWRNWIARETSNLKVVGSNPITDLWEVTWTGSRAVKGGRLKIYCDMLRGFESHPVHIVFFS